MRLMTKDGSGRVITEMGELKVQERHCGEWWTRFRVSLEHLSEVCEEYLDYLSCDV